MSKVDLIVTRLASKGFEPQQNGKGWLCRCPAHDDQRASLAIDAGDDGRALVHCFAGCSVDAVCTSIGMKVSDLMPSATQQVNRILATYDYCDESGALVFQVVRFEPKDFRQRKPKVGGGWDWRVKGVRKVPYRLPTILNCADWLFVVEGEKDVHSLEQIGLVATCNAGGAGKWLKSHADCLKGKRVVVLPDNDETGRCHASQVAQSLQGIAEVIKVVELSGLPVKGDVSDWVAAGGTRDELLKLVVAANEWKPTEATVKPTREKLLYSLDDISGQTDIANSRRFVDKFVGQLLFVPPWGKWLSWDGKRWHDDNGTGAAQRAKKYADGLWFELGRLAPQLSRSDLEIVTSFIRATSQSAKLSAFMRLAESDERVVCPVESLNSDPLLLNVKNGTIDLRTGLLRPHNPDDRLTQLTSVAFDAGATCPKWLDTLNLVFNGDQQLIDYVQMILGYSISGDVGEAILPICFGSGNNGKSTVWNAIVELLGDYSMLANESLLLGDGEGHPTDKAMLYQLRFVPISEPERGSRLRESRVKELTGDSTITARRMREDFWSFKRTHTFWLSTNHLPKVSGTDQGIWRRIKLIPFTVDLSTKVQPIPDYSSWLVRNEGPGILNWLLDGWRRYQAARRFNEPEAVRMATSNYRSDSDSLGEWIAENCQVEAGAVVTANELFERYLVTGGKWSKTAFGTAMAERFEKDRPSVGEYRKQTIYHGVRLLTDLEKNQEKQGLPTVAHSYPVDFKNTIRERELTGKVWATMGKGQKPCPNCGSKMVAKPAESGWQNWDCPACDMVVPERVQG